MVVFKHLSRVISLEGGSAKREFHSAWTMHVVQISSCSWTSPALDSSSLAFSSSSPSPNF